MSSVNVTINGRQFRIACDDGQEASLETLARSLDERIEKLRGNFGEIGDTRLTVMVAIQVADELAEMHKRLRNLEEEIAMLKDARIVAADRAHEAQQAVTNAFNSAAERIEKLTKTLNQGVGTGMALG